MRAELGKEPTRAPHSQLYLPPGFRFYPTDEELVVHYLCKKAACEPFAVPIIAEVELYKFDPWDLPDKALFGEREWYFFSPRDRKYPNGLRPNRAAGGGYWKATGTDKPISTLGGKKKVGVKKALVFYNGKAPKGVKTNWIMHEYRLADAGTSISRPSTKRKGNLRLDDWVLCRIYKKSSSAANQEKELYDTLDDIQAEQSESSGLDDVLATLSELNDPADHPVDALSEEAEDAHADMAQFGCLERQNFSLQSSMEGLYYESVSAYSSQADGLRHNMEDLSAYSSQGDGLRHGMEDLGGMARLESRCDGGNAKEYGLQDAGSFVKRENVGTPESNVSSRHDSPTEYSQSTSGQQEEEEMREDDTLNALARLPLTQLLNNTQNLGVASNPLFGLDLGLPSPGTMLAQGSSFGSSLMSVDPDNFLFPSTLLTTGDPNRIHFKM